MATPDRTGFDVAVTGRRKMMAFQTSPMMPLRRAVDDKGRRPSGWLGEELLVDEPLGSAVNEAKGDPALAELYDVVVRLLEGESPRPPRLVHEKRIRNWLTRAYYNVLNDDDKFRSDLANLLKHWTWTAAESFAKRWSLPERGLADLAWTLSLSRRGALKVPRLQVGSRSYPGLEEDADEDQARHLGYRPHPPRLKDKQSLRLGAQRLYRRAVLKWPWKKIAASETKERRWPVGVKTVWDDVKRWAKALGVPLPRVPRGRPRKSAYRNS